MKKIVRDLGVIIGMFIVLYVGFYVGQVYDPISTITPILTPTYDNLIDAIEWKECAGDWSAIGKLDELGSFQLRKIYVKDVNRLIDLYSPSNPHMTYDQRLNRKISRAAVDIYLIHYATYDRLGHEPTFEDMARIHNGGPNGWKKQSTKQYWLDVKSIMESR